MSITPPLKANVQAMIEGTDVPVVTSFKRVCDKLKLSNLMYKVKLHTSAVMVHPKNRNGLGLNPYEAHRNLLTIHRIGADRNQLKYAYAFEKLGGKPGEEQMLFNSKLVAASNGLLAKLDGGERVCSVGCGHTAALCRAANGQCKSLSPALADDNGNLDANRLKKDPELKLMLEDGWEWWVVHADAELAWPMLPDLFQRALNAFNSVPSKASELEVSCGVAEFASLSSARGDAVVDWDKCVAAATAGAPACSPYAAVLGRLARYYGGGQEAPALKALDAFAKKYSINKIIGEEMLTSVVDTVFAEFEKFPKLRIALLATNLTSPKSVDGIARLLTPSDVTKLKGKLPALREFESMLTHAETMIEKYKKNGKLSADDGMVVYGIFRVRLAAHLCGKGKLTFDATDHDSPRAICAMFVEELSAAAKIPSHKLDLPEQWTGLPTPTQGATTTDAPEAPQAKQGLLTGSDLQDPVWIITNKGFRVGDRVYEKEHGSGPVRDVYKITSVGSETLLEKLVLFQDDGEAVRVKVPMEVFLSKWARHKADLQQVIPDDWHKRVIGESKVIDQDAMRASVLLALQQLWAEWPFDAGAFILTAKPSQIRAAKSFKAGEVVFVPLVPLSSIKLVNNREKLPLGAVNSGAVLNDLNVVINKPGRQVESADVSKWRDECVAPFFMVKTTSDTKLVNMKLSTRPSCGMNLVVLVNTKKIGPRTELLSYVPKKVVTTPLSGAMVVESGEEDDDEEEEEEEEEEEGEEEEGDEEEEPGDSSVAGEPPAKKAKAGPAKGTATPAKTTTTVSGKTSKAQTGKGKGKGKVKKPNQSK